MTNYEQIKGLFQKFADKYKRQICIETELSSASEDKAETKRTTQQPNLMVKKK